MIHRSPTKKFNVTLHPPLAMQLARFGHPESEISTILGISAQTLKKWKEASPAFADALRVGKAQVLSDCEAALYKLAVGYEYWDWELKTYKGRTTREKVLRYHHPEYQAAKLILERQDRERWGDVQRMELTQTITNIAKFELPAELFTTEELRLFDKIVHRPKMIESAN